METIEQNRLAQKQREKTLRLAAAIQHAKSYANLAHTLSDEVWEKLEKEAANDRGA